MRRLLLSLLALPLLLLGMAAPASAATINTFTVNGASGTVVVEPDTQLDVAWEVEGNAELVVTASGTGWTGPLDPSGTTTVDGPDAGQSLTFILSADDVEATPVSQTITVTAEDDEPEGSTPPPVVLEGCLVTVPESDDFTYELVYDGDPDDTEEIEAGTYTASELTADGLFEIEIVAVPGDGVDVAPGATTSFEVPFSEECAGPALLEATGGQCSFEVENVSDAEVFVLYGNPDGSGRADGEFTLAAGQSRTVSTPREFLLVVGLAGDPEDEDADDFGFQVLPLEVSQDGCDGEGATGSGRRWPIPVNAPAAGVSAAGVTPGQGSAPWLLAGLVLAGGLAAGAVRRRAAS